MTNSLTIELIRVAVFDDGTRNTICFHAEAGFSTFYIGLKFTGTLIWVNILSLVAVAKHISTRAAAIVSKWDDQDRVVLAWSLPALS